MRLLTTRRFLPLFITQFLGAFNDNLFKNALVMLLAFKMGEHTTIAPSILIIAAGGLFIFPYFLFSATAGQLADKIDKARLARITKLWEIIVVGLGAIGFVGHHPMFLLAVLFALGVQSTFFGPVKYALLPQHLHEDELVTGNALIEAATFLAILLGTISGGVLVMQQGGEWKIVVVTLLVALAGYAASWFIPKAPAPAPQLRIDANIFKATWRIVQHDRKNIRVFRAIFGITWLWVLGAVYLSQFPTMAKDMFGGDESLVTLFLTMFSLGIGVGSMLSSRLTKGKIDSGYCAFAAFTMALFSFDLALTCVGQSPLTLYSRVDAATFLYGFGHLRVLADLFMIALSGGVFVVPLYAIMQHDSEVESRARTIATNNIVNAFFMVLSAVVTATLVAAGASFVHIAALIGVCSAAVGFYIHRLKK